MIKAIIFDMDGTLVDSADIVLRAFKHVIEGSGQVYDEVIVRSYIGRLLDHTYESLFPNRDASELIAIHRAWQADNKHLLRGFEGLGELLEELKQSKLKIGLFTSAVRSRTEVVLSELGIRKFFDAIICGDEVANPKPHHEGLERVAKMVGVNSSEVVFVGDAEHDILSGKHAGVITIGITHGFGTKEALEAAGADYIVNNLKEVQEVIEKLMLDNSK